MGSSLLGVGRTALLVQQQALQVLSQNIANADTPGYSRQEAVLAANTPLRLPYGNVGTGVSIATIQRKRDTLLDDGVRSASGQAGESALRSTLLGQIEGIVGNLSEGGMADALDQFWGAWSELAANPTNGAAQAVVQQRGRQLAQRFNDYDGQLTRLRQTNLDRVQGTVERINSLATQVADLNSRIVATEGNNATANDLRDTRDRLIDELSTLASTRVFPSATNGAVQVIVGTTTLVDGASVQRLTARVVPQTPPPATPNLDPPVRIYSGKSPDPVTGFGGELGAVLDVLGRDIPDMRGRLDALASALAREVNTAHSGGYTFNGTAIPGNPAGPFFDPGTVALPVRAATLRLSSAVAADPRAVAVSGDATAPTGNSVAQTIAGLRLAPATVSYTSSTGVTDGGTFFSFFQRSVTQLGIEVQAARTSADVGTALREQAEARRESVSGVNIDEELVQMVRLQQSYTAASKLIQTADEMLQTVLQLI